MKISIGCDHIAIQPKNQMIKFLEKLGHEVIDNGTYDNKRTHFPIYGKKTAEKVIEGEADLGIVMCGTGVGITASANKIPGVRAALVRDVATAVHAKREWNANILGMGGRIVGEGLMEEIIEAFLEADYKPAPEKNAMINELDTFMETNGGKGDDSYFDDLLEKWQRGEYTDEEK